MDNFDKGSHSSKWRWKQKKVNQEEIYKSKTDDFLNTLSLVSSEDIREVNEVLVEFSKFQILIDEKLIPGLEMVQYENKYELINCINEECLNIVFYLYFKELIGKTVIGFDFISPSEIYKLTLKEYLDTEIRGNTLWNLFMKKEGKVALSDSVPTVISSINDSSVIEVLNVSGNIISISNKQYVDFLTYSYNENIDISSLVHGILVPGNVRKGSALIFFPENVDKAQKYYDAYCNAIDILVIDAGKCDINDLLKYKNVTEVLVVGNVSKEQKMDFQRYAEEHYVEIKYGSKVNSTIKSVISADYSKKNNFSYLTIVSNLLYENTWYLANKHDELRQFIESINEDLLFKSKDTGNSLKKIQQKYKEELDELEKIYFEYKKISDLLLDMLSGIQDSLGIKENTILDSCKYCTNNHVKMESVYIDLIVKMVETFKNFPEQNGKDIIRKYCNIYSALSEKKNPEDLFLSILMGEHYKYKFSPTDYYDDKTGVKFFGRCVIKYSELLGIPLEKCSNLLFEDLTYSKMNKFSSKENLLLGLIKIADGDLQSAKEYLLRSAMQGNDSASSVLHKDFKLTLPEMEILAEYGDTQAAYELAKMIRDDVIGTDKFCWKDAIKYLHISAAKNNMMAIKLLGDIWYDEFYSDNSQKDFADDALYYYLVAEKNGSNDKKMFERMGHLSYELEKYKTSFEYFTKSKTAASFYYMGLMLEQGNGCAANEDKALECYEKAMGEGHSEAAVQYEKLNAEIESRNKKNIVDESVSYTSTSYYSGYYSYYSGW